ncbi:baseplate protein, partial [Escherichia coli]|nr:baseplate protein [Escherichia coli]
NPLFRMSRDNSKHYVLVYKPTEQIGVRFGDGSMGMMPAAGSQVRIDIMASLGDYTLAEGQKLEPAGNISGYVESLEVKTDSIISGGGGMETTEETRNRAQYYVAYDEQVVWGGDYRQFIQNVVSGTSWLN